jgi:DNA-binding MarR family transcriptional regulator
MRYTLHMTQIAVSTVGDAAARGARTGDTDPTLEVADLLGQAVRRLHRGTNEALAPLGLSRAQARLVRLVADGPLRMTAIAERLGVVPRTVTDVVDGLEATGLVARRPDPEDRRATFIALTPGGVELLDRLDAVRRESAAQLLGRLAPDDLATLRLLLLDLIAGVADDCPPAHEGRGTTGIAVSAGSAAEATPR